MYKFIKRSYEKFFKRWGFIMLVLKRRQLILSALVVMILVAGYLNINYKEEVDSIPTGNEQISAISEDESTASKNLGEAMFVNKEEKGLDKNEKENVIARVDSGNEYFIEARMERERARSEALEVMKSIVDNTNSSGEMKVNAQREMLEISKKMAKESIVENLIKAKDFPDAVVFMDEGIINVVVKSEGLAATQTAQITDIVVSQTGVQLDKVKILEIK
jgi:stage III sporulation protein AH